MIDFNLISLLMIKKIFLFIFQHYLEIFGKKLITRVLFKYFGQVDIFVSLLISFGNIFKVGGKEELASLAESPKT
jgi:hypothetical protein